MARPAPRSGVAAFPWRSLEGPLDAAQRGRIAANLFALLQWQRNLSGFPKLARGLPDASPFVSLYANGRLCGCFGSDEGSPGERLARAFLRALEDMRFGPLTARERPHLVAQVSYALRVRAMTSTEALSELEIGTHGVSLLARDGSAPVLLLPDTARDGVLRPGDLLAAAARKAGLGPEGWHAARLASFETAGAVSRGHAARSPVANGVDAGFAWLARLLGRDGSVLFAIDGRKRLRHAEGPMHHGRAAMVIRALGSWEGKNQRVRAAVERARARLAREVDAVLEGGSVSGFPDHPAMVAGTCALACLAGAADRRALAAYARDRREVTTNPWHAAQVALALGDATAPRVWRAALADLDRQPWAPWTLLAARARGDTATVARCEVAIVESIRKTAPHVGGAAITPIPELALTALAVESLSGSSRAPARRAVELGRSFLRRWQHGHDDLRAALDPAFVGGAFPISPVVDLARGDVTAHALLALGPSG